ncbi:uncharacterized protein BT62DRAFT_955208 [Guyanagaster necrorhizus]|uniref:Rhodanese domain-containing protein n=1 Tax=Guyanagaster necrorhizus TaxID=856835 RepID=A0A9P8APN6_9AGAR|nr:uncharacterized protein BT62DRAFT_955208 [Guyanagaster necrorhizus MCA 3950]KAG7442057.1 hypothetical protein BT62DRAFT_955208 [Guyanagaster necrorhizus MCA 3950]
MSSSYSSLGEILVGPANTPQRPTLADIRAIVADEIAVRARLRFEIVDDARISVSLTSSKSDDVDFLTKIGENIQLNLAVHNHICAVATTGPYRGADAIGHLLISASSMDFSSRASILARAKFMNRVASFKDIDGTMWIAGIRDLGMFTYDTPAIWDILRKSARNPIDPLHSPPGSQGIEERLSNARAKLQRLTPQNAYEELRILEDHVPTILVDIRPAAQREAEGFIEGSIIVERNVLEWRFDPRSEYRLPIVDRYDLRTIIMCHEGYTSSLAAVSLQELGLLNATDIIGGFRAWKEAGLPLTIPEPVFTSRDDISESIVIQI